MGQRSVRIRETDARGGGGNHEGEGVTYNFFFAKRGGLADPLRIQGILCPRESWRGGKKAFTKKQGMGKNSLCHRRRTLRPSE